MNKNICFINNYNNEKYIRNCLESVYSQTTQFDEVILVDDGSTDSSLEIILHFSLKKTNFKLLRKKNEGQLSTFNFILPFIPENCQIFLLDGDDIYPSDYLSNVLKLVGDKGWDFAFCEQQNFFDDEVHSINSAIIGDQKPNYFSNTSALTRSRGCWIGSPTSCISLSDKVFREIFAYPGAGDGGFWVDDLLIYASSILGVRKIHLPSLGIGYRTHGANNSKKLYTAHVIKSRKLSIDKAFNWYCKKCSIPRYPSIGEFFAEHGALGEYWQKRLDLPSRYRMFNRLLRNSVKQAFRELL